MIPQSIFGGFDPTQPCTQPNFDGLRETDFKPPQIAGDIRVQLRVVADGPRDRGGALRPPRAAHRGRNRAMEVEQEKNHKIHFFSVERSLE